MHQTQTDAPDTLTSGEPAAEPLCEVIVAVEPPLLRDMLSRLIGRIEGLHLRAELSGPTNLASLLDRESAQWVIVSLGPEGQMPERIDSVLAQHPATSVVGIAEDGSEVQVEYAGSAIEALANPSLALLIGLMLEKGRAGVGCDRLAGLVG